MKHIKIHQKFFLIIVYFIQILSVTSEAKTLDREEIDLLNKVLNIVDREYIEETEQDDLIEAAINGMLKSLDPHSSYLPPRDFENLQNDTSGEFGGIGIEVTMENGLIQVISPIDETPAQKAGLLSGDFITHINKEPILGKSLNEAVDLMRGKPNTEVLITIVREDLDNAFDVMILRDIIQVPGVKTELKGGNNNIGYIRISAFNEKTSEKLFTELLNQKNALNSNIRGYILDLRRNPGGLLRQAIEVTNMFLDSGEIVSTKRPRFEGKVNSFEANRGDLLSGKPLIILVNGGSASASEIVAGALQDHNRATIIGTRTFGKGSVQTLYPINKNNLYFPNSKNLGALKLTTAEYYTPSGRSIQAEGIMPDFIIEQKTTFDNNPDLYKVGETQLSQFMRKSDKDTNQSGSSTYIPSDSKDDTQLNLAIEIMEKLLSRI